MAFSTERNPTNSAMEGTDPLKGDQKVVKQVFKMLLLDYRHCYSTVRQLKAKVKHKWIERSLCVIQVICWDSRAVEWDEEIKSLPMTTTSTAILRMERSFMSVMKAVLNYARAFDLQWVVSFSEARIKDIVVDMMSSLYLREPLRLSCVRYVEFGRLLSKIGGVLSLLKLLNEGREDVNELKISQLDREVLHAIQSSFVVLLLKLPTSRSTVLQS